jgi:hypothetical protein
VFDLREPFLVGDVCDSSIKSVEGAYVADTGRILIVSAFGPVVSFMQMCQIIDSVQYVGCKLTHPYKLIGSGCAVLPRKRALIVSIEENGLYYFNYFEIYMKGKSYRYDNDFALVGRFDCSLHLRKSVVGITLEAMYYYDGLSGRSKVYIVGNIVHEHAAVPDCQARAVDICCRELWKRRCLESDVCAV